MREKEIDVSIGLHQPHDQLQKPLLFGGVECRQRGETEIQERKPLVAAQLRELVQEEPHAEELFRGVRLQKGGDGKTEAEKAGAAEDFFLLFEKRNHADRRPGGTGICRAAAAARKS